MGRLRLRKRFVVALAGALGVWGVSWWARSGSEAWEPAGGGSHPAAETAGPALPPGAVPLDAPLPEPDPTAPRPLRAQTSVLPNGLTLIVVEDHTAPTLSAHVVFRVGSLQDPPDRAGLAHVVQHGVLSGSDRFPASPAPLRLLIEALGAREVDADTSVERTDFRVVLPANELEPWAVAMHEAVSRPAFRSVPADVAAAEAERAQGSACTPSRHALFAGLFRDHPYGSPVGGTPEGLARIDAESVRRFAETWYTADNAAVVLVGDVDAGDARSVAERTFGTWYPAAAPVAGRLPGTVARSGIERLPGGREGELTLGWGLAPLEAGDQAALAVYARGLEREVARRLPSGRLRPRVTASIVPLRAAGALVVEASCGKGCEALVRAAVARPPGELVSEEALRADVHGAWVDALRSLEGASEQAEALVEAWARGAPVDAAWQTALALPEVSVEQVDAVVNRVLRPEGTALLTVSAAPAPEAAPLSVGDEGSAFTREVLAIPVPEARPGWGLAGGWTSSPDGRVVAVPNPANSLFQAELVWPLGWRADSALCGALVAWLDDGDTRATGYWRSTLRDAGVRVRVATCAWERVVIAAEGPGPVAPSALARLTAEIRDPKFDPAARRAVAVPAAQLAERRWLALLVGPLPVLSPEVLGGGDTRVLRDALRVLSAAPPDLRYAGTYDATTIAPFVAPGRRATPLAPAVWPAVRGHQVVIDAGRSPRVVAVRASEAYDPAREGLYRLYEQWLEGRGGPLFTASAGASLRVDYTRGNAEGQRNFLRVDLPVHDPSAVVGRVAEGLTTTVSDAEWARLLVDTAEELWEEQVNFRRLPGALAAGVDRGLPGDAREVAWRQVMRVDRADFEAFLADEAAEPLRFLVSGPDLDVAALAAVGAVANP